MFLSNHYISHYKANFRLAYPVIIGQLGQVFTAAADNMMVGRLGSTHLAASSLANTIFILIMMFGMGASIGITPLVGKAIGSRDDSRLGILLRNGVFLNTIIGLISGFLIILAAGFIDRLNQPADVVELAIPYFKILSISMIPMMIFLSFKQFLEGMQLTKPGMIASIIGNILNIILNYGLIYGNFGMPALGLNGAGYGTLISRALTALVLILFMLTNKKLRQYLKFIISIDFSWNEIKKLINVGFPIGFQYIMEVGNFTIAAIFVGWAGSIHLAAHQIALNLASMTFFIASGFSTAATIRISNFNGQKSIENLKMVSHSSYFMGIAFMTFSALMFILFRQFLPQLYIKETAVIHLAAQLLITAGIFQIFDGMQVIGIGILRGFEDVKIPSIIALFAYWIVGLPVCYYLGVTLELGALGVWTGFIISLGLAAILLYLRVRKISKERFTQIRSVQAI